MIGKVIKYYPEFESGDIFNIESSDNEWYYGYLDGNPSGGPTQIPTYSLEIQHRSNEEVRGTRTSKVRSVGKFLKKLSPARLGVSLQGRYRDFRNKRSQRRRRNARKKKIDKESAEWHKKMQVTRDNQDARMTRLIAEEEETRRNGGDELYKEGGGKRKRNTRKRNTRKRNTRKRKTRKKKSRKIKSRRP